MDAQEKEEVYQDFKEKVNMAPQEIEDWLGTKESKSVGQDSGDGEAIGHKSGKRIVKIMRTNKADLSDDQYAHMQKVNGYVARHVAQKPEEVEGSDWLYSLKNWGHDPTK